MLDDMGIKGIAQEAADELTLLRLQTPPGAMDTVPVGVVGDPEVSVTIAVHELSWPIVTGLGTHETVVVVV